MKRVELELEHRFQNRFVGKHRLKPDGDLTIVGSTRDAGIRLLGDNVSGVHATFEFTAEGWTLCDMGSEHGTWVKKRPIVEQIIRGTTVVNIGGHHIKVVPREIDSDLFRMPAPGKAEISSGSQVFHQVVIRKKGFVVESHLLAPDENFEYSEGDKVHTLVAPTKKDHWTQKAFGDVNVQQRLVSSSQIEQSGAEKVKSHIDPSLRGPMAAAMLMLLLIMGLVFFAPEKPDEELVELKPEKNKYTRMIFDANKIKKNRKESMKITKNIEGHVKTAPQRKNTTGGPTSAKKTTRRAAKVVSKIKAAGLGQLIGKISKRAAKTADFVKATGRSPDSQTGRALGISGNPTLGKAAGGIAGSDGHKIGGVQTAGKGGGNSAYKGVGGLSLGNVGNATVGVLEEETEIQGGLDREVIARYIKSQLGQIRYCYERQLSASPDLYGKVKVKFTIGASGSVIAQAINATSLKNAMVEGCILRRIAGWRFPKPKGGTQVNVSYPFLFKSTK